MAANTCQTCLSTETLPAGTNHCAQCHDEIPTPADVHPIYDELCQSCGDGDKPCAACGEPSPEIDLRGDICRGCASRA